MAIAADSKRLSRLSWLSRLSLLYADTVLKVIQHEGMRLVDVLMYTPSQVADVLMLSRSTAYGLMCKGTIPSVKIGGCRRVPRGAFHDYIDELTGS
jgi:excisionase family DNA binding protein